MDSALVLSSKVIKSPWRHLRVCFGLCTYETGMAVTIRSSVLSYKDLKLILFCQEPIREPVTLMSLVEQVFEIKSIEDAR